MKLVLLALVLSSAACSFYEKNTKAEIIIVKLSDQVNNDHDLDFNNLSQVLLKLDEAEAKAIALKMIINQSPQDSLLEATLRGVQTAVYGSATVLDDGLARDNEDLYFNKLNILLKRSFRNFSVPSERLIDQFKGIGPENVTYRNSGQIESYYVVSAINGKTYPSLAMLLAMDVLNLKPEDVPYKIKTSKNGSMPIRYSEPGEAYPAFTDKEILVADFDLSLLKSSVIFIYYGDEEFVTRSGVMNRAEISADALNQLIILME